MESIPSAIRPQNKVNRARDGAAVTVEILFPAEAGQTG
jgi:hypothetical protein